MKKIKNIIQSLSLKPKKDVVVLDSKTYNQIQKAIKDLKELEKY